MSDKKGPKVQTKKIDPEYLKAIKEGAVGWNSDQKEAIDTLTKACILGQQAGVYSLEDARKIMNAIDVITESLPKDEEITEDKK